MILRSAGRPVALVGDLIHHPLELDANMPGPGDLDVGTARQTRARVLARLVRAGALVLGAAFPGGAHPGTPGIPRATQPGGRHGLSREDDADVR